MPPPNVRSIAVLHWEACKHGNIQVDPVKVASLAEHPSFVLFHSHIDHSNSKLRASANTTNDSIIIMLQGVFNALSAAHDFQPAVQPQNENALLQLTFLIFTVTNNDWNIKAGIYFLTWSFKRWVITLLH